MTSDITERYRKQLLSSLADWKPLLRSELSLILTAKFHPEVDLLHFEFFDDSICESFFPFFLYSHRKRDGVQYYGTPIPSARQTFEIPSHTKYFSSWYHLLSGEKRSIVDRDLWITRAEETDYSFIDEESQIIHDWFVECWREVGGTSISIDSYLIRTYADEMDEGFDLRRYRQVKWLDIWR